MIQLERLAMENVRWEELDLFPDRMIFQTRAWLDFLVATQGGEPVVAAIREKGEVIGYFTGMIIRKFGIKILGSPFKGWTTVYMGFNLAPGRSRRKVLGALPAFAFKQLGCHYLEIVDRQLQEDDYQDFPAIVEYDRSFEIDLTGSEEELFAAMHRSCRKSIRKAEKTGLVIEEAVDPDFAAEFYEQFIDVFAKQALTPPFSKKRVEEMIANLLPTGNLLLLRVKSPDGTCIATGIFPACNRTMFFWGGASWRSHQKLRPNEPMVWYAMRYWRARGITVFDMGGDDSKKKFGSTQIARTRLILPRFKILFTLREAARLAFGLVQKVKGMVKMLPGQVK